jgi:hypothetical protein
MLNALPFFLIPRRMGCSFPSHEEEARAGESSKRVMQRDLYRGSRRQQWRPRNAAPVSDPLIPRVFGQQGGAIGVSSKQFEDSPHSDAHATDTRFPAALPGLNRDAVESSKGRHMLQSKPPDGPTARGAGLPLEQMAHVIGWRIDPSRRGWLIRRSGCCLRGRSGLWSRSSGCGDVRFRLRALSTGPG